MKKFLHVLRVALFGTHLWFQLVYIVLFVIVSAVTGTLGSNWDVFLMGLSPTFLVSLILTYRDKKHAEEMCEVMKTGNHSAEPEPAPESNIKQAGAAMRSEETAAETHTDAPAVSNIETESAINSQIGAAQSYSQPIDYSQSFQGSFAQPVSAQPYQQNYQNVQPIQGSYMDNMNNGTVNNDFQNYIAPHQNIPGFKPEQPVEKPEPEKPKIYRSRTDSSVIIYDYSDRTEYYRLEENNSVTLRQTKYK